MYPLVPVPFGSLNVNNVLADKELPLICQNLAFSIFRSLRIDWVMHPILDGNRNEIIFVIMPPIYHGFIISQEDFSFATYVCGQ